MPKVKYQIKMLRALKFYYNRANASFDKFDFKGASRDYSIVISHVPTNANAYYMLTTEKDYVRIAHRITWGIDLVVIGIDISFGDNEEAFSRFIKDHLKVRKNEQAVSK